MAGLFIHFGDHTDRAAPHMFHCHILEHEDRAMVPTAVPAIPPRRPSTVVHLGCLDGAARGDSDACTPRDRHSDSDDGRQPALRG
jgi:hypothetical protein